MRDVEPGSVELLSQLDIAVNDCGFGIDAHPAQAQAERGWALVHRAVLGDTCVFRVLNDRKINLC